MDNFASWMRSDPASRLLSGACKRGRINWPPEGHIKMNVTPVKTRLGQTINLFTDDTFTLAFEGMIETTPAQLRNLIEMDSLKKIAITSNDSNERSKAERALKLRVSN